jgi:hypothetical protein
VFSYRKDAAADEPGGALFIPPQGRGRIDNADHYTVRYLTRQPEAAVAEVLGVREAGPIGQDSLRGSPLLTGSVLALATFEVPTVEKICNLDDPKELVARGLKPSKVVTRDYRTTQHWALQIFREGRRRAWIGVCWWSYYESLWTSAALWSHDAMTLQHVELLQLDHKAVIGAARVLRRPILR